MGHSVAILVLALASISPTSVKSARVALVLPRKRSLLSPLSERVLHGRPHVVSEKKDGSGRHWGLLESGALGNATDLWLAEKIGGKWANPLFTGVYASRFSRQVKKTPAATIDGLTGAKLLKANWVKLLVGNPMLTSSSDRSGLTDIEKARLGLPLGSTDSDGDGDPDAADPWPNAPNRPLDDAEQVLAAAFEARFHFDKSVSPMIFVAPSNMKPFEMPGRHGPTLWDSEADKGPLDDCFENGVGYIDFEPQGKSKSWERRLIRWSKDRSRAEVDIGVLLGGKNGTIHHLKLRKLLGQWVVADMAMAAEA